MALLKSSKKVDPKIKVRKVPELVGSRVGRLLVVQYLGHVANGKKVQSLWLCRCDCGNLKEVLRTGLYQKTNSCGCLQKEVARKSLGNQTGQHNRAYRHGKSHELVFQRERAIVRKFGISVLEYQTLLEKQKSSCAICKAPTTEFKKFLGVDHNHTTGKVRGLLCAACNIGLGMFKDNMERLAEAIRYLSATNAS
jgi:hypothetical protein